MWRTKGPAVTDVADVVDEYRGLWEAFEDEGA